LLCAHGFQLLQYLLRRPDAVGHICGLALLCGGCAGRHALLLWGPLVVWPVAGLGLGLREGVWRCRLNAVNRLRRLGRCSGGTRKDELLGCSIVRHADEQIVKVETGEQAGDDVVWLAGAVYAKDAVVTGGALYLHAGLRGDGLENLEKLGVAGFDGELSVLESDCSRHGGLAGKRDGDLRRCWCSRLLRDVRGRFWSLRGNERRGNECACREHTGCRESAPWTLPGGRGRHAGCRKFTVLIHGCLIGAGFSSLCVLD